MPDIRPRRKSVPLVSELVRNQLSINVAGKCPIVYANMDMYTYTRHGRVFTLSESSMPTRENKQSYDDGIILLVYRCLVIVLLFVLCPHRRRVVVNIVGVLDRGRRRYFKTSANQKIISTAYMTVLLNLS